MNEFELQWLYWCWVKRVFSSHWTTCGFSLSRQRRQIMRPQQAGYRCQPSAPCGLSTTVLDSSLFPDCDLIPAFLLVVLGLKPGRCLRYLRPSRWLLPSSHRQRWWLLAKLFGPNETDWAGPWRDLPTPSNPYDSEVWWSAGKIILVHDISFSSHKARVFSSRALQGKFHRTYDRLGVSCI